MTFQSPRVLSRWALMGALFGVVPGLVACNLPDAFNESTLSQGPEVNSVEATRSGSNLVVRVSGENLNDLSASIGAGKTAQVVKQDGSSAEIVLMNAIGLASGALDLLISNAYGSTSVAINLRVQPSLPIKVPGDPQNNHYICDKSAETCQKKFHDRPSNIPFGVPNDPNLVERFYLPPVPFQVSSATTNDHYRNDLPAPASVTLYIRFDSPSVAINQGESYSFGMRFGTSQSKCVVTHKGAAAPFVFTPFGVSGVNYVGGLMVVQPSFPYSQLEMMGEIVCKGRPLQVGEYIERNSTHTGPVMNIFDIFMVYQFPSEE